jgi:enterochelin esterase family protein
MQKDAQGVWAVTLGPLEPDLYGYSFLVDGVSQIDPSNPRVSDLIHTVVPQFVPTQSMLHIPGRTLLPWEVADVPHGIIHQHFFKSNVTGDIRDFYVYTPPGYDPLKKQSYPVLCLLHGYSDDASGWIIAGRANLILDNLIAQGKAKPMILVMPLGYGTPEALSRGFQMFRDDSLRKRNFDLFRESLLNEVLPQVEKHYAVSKDGQSWAIAGLSMGGAESLLTGLNATNRFAWVGSFSAGGLDEDFAAAFPELDARANNLLQLLWIACGKDDGLLEINRKFGVWLSSKGVHYTQVETSGGHTWMVFRRSLATFVPLLFQSSSQ